MKDIEYFKKLDIDQLITESYWAIVIGAYDKEFNNLMKVWGSKTLQDETYNRNVMYNRISDVFFEITIGNRHLENKRYSPLDFKDRKIPPKVTYLYRFESILEEFGFSIPSHVVEDVKHLIGTYDYQKIKYLID